MSKQTIPAEEHMNRNALICELDQDYERFPIPISFDPREEQKLLYLRGRGIADLVNRYFRLKSLKNKNCEK